MRNRGLVMEGERKRRRITQSDFEKERGKPFEKGSERTRESLIPPICLSARFVAIYEPMAMERQTEWN